MATAAQDGIARAIVPAHTPHDGDLVFGLSTGAEPLVAPPMQLSQICHAASVCLSRAIARSVWEATPADGDTLPTLRDTLG
jgi:D-aminopeptidase